MINLNYNRQLLFAGCIFTLHNAEEAWGYLHIHWPENLPWKIIPAMEMVTAIGLITCIGWVAVIFALLQKNHVLKRFLLTTLLSVFLINAFIPHILGAIYLGHYFPAVITAIVFYLPYVYLILPPVYHDFGSRMQFWKTAGQGIGISVACLVTVQFIAGLLT